LAHTGFYFHIFLLFILYLLLEPCDEYTV